MALKYYLEFIDLVGILHRAEINDPNYNDSPIQVNGYVEISSGNVDSPIECIRGTGLKLILDANTNLTFSDLYSENERTFKVTYIRDGLTEFVGFLNPEGLFEDYVSDKWTITLICADGLSFLKNLSYVDNDTGEQFRGKQSELEIISNCLKRTDLRRNFNTSIGISYTGQTPNTNVLAETYLNAERFLKDDNQDTIMNCDEVLRSVLEKYNAVVQFFQGEWYIYRPIELFNFTSRIFYSYDFTSAPLSPTTKEIDFTYNIGSQIDGFNPFWANTNQQKRIKNSIGAYRINLKYGLIRNALANEFLESDNGVLFNYTINDPSLISFPPEEQGINIAGSASTVIVATSDPITVSNIDAFEVQFVNKSGNDTGTPFVVNNRIGYRVKVSNVTDTFYMSSSGGWTSSIVSIDVDTIFESFTAATIQSDTVPINGQLTVEIQDSLQTASGFFVFVNKISVRPITSTDTGIRGENHSFEKTVNPSTKILDTKEIFNGDIPSDLYDGTIYKSDEITPTDTWLRDGFTTPNPILRIMGEDTMSMFQAPSIEFKGDIYGFIPYMSRIIINNNDGIYVPIEYAYNIKQNTIRLKLRQIYGFFSGITYEFNFDYGNVVDPTIRG